MITTVRGPVAATDLGHTLAHEHVISSSAGLGRSFPEIIDRPATIIAATAELSTAREEVGIGTVVDMCPFDLGRDVRALVEVSTESGVNIVCASGTWRAPPREFVSADPDFVAALFVREITVGIDRTAIRAGILKSAADDRGVTPERERLLRAVGRAHLQTGVPIATHAHAPSRAGWQQLDVLEDEGVDLSRVCIGHSDDTTDLGYITAMLERGAWVGLDHLAYAPEHTPTQDDRIDLVISLLQGGFGDRLLVGHDHNPTMSNATPEKSDFIRRMNPDGYLYFHRRVRPRLLEAGIDAGAVDAFTLDNPAAFLEPQNRVGQPIV